MSADTPWTVAELDEMIASAKAAGNAEAITVLSRHRDQAEADELRRAEQAERYAGTDGIAQMVDDIWRGSHNP